MIIRLFVILLGLCGLGLILCGLMETMCTSGVPEVYHVILLWGEASTVEDRVRKALHTLKGQLYFVDLGLDPDGQMSVELLLRDHSFARLLAPEQLRQELRWENEVGTGTDQGNGYHCNLSE